MLKGGLSVKKLDNGIYAFKALAELSKGIVREKSRLYQEEKKANPDCEEQQLDDLTNLKVEDSKNVYLKELFTQYTTAHANLIIMREHEKTYDELDTLYA